MLGGRQSDITSDAAALQQTLPDDWLEPEEEFELWPEHVQVVDLFWSARSQWRVFPSGAYQGLDYGAVMHILQLKQIPNDTWPQLFRDLQVMEFAALAIWSEARDE